MSSRGSWRISWQLGPTLRSARGHRAAVFLVTLQLALGIAIALVSVLIGVYMAKIRDAPSGIADRELNLVHIRLPGHLADSERGETIRRELTELARRTEGATAVTTIGQVPFTFWERSPDTMHVAGAAYDVTGSELEAGPGVVAGLGIRLVAGRDLEPADLHAPTARAIVSAALARELFGAASAVGRRFHSRAHGETEVVGVAAQLRLYPEGIAPPSLIYASAGVGGARLLLLVRSRAAELDQVGARLRQRLATPGLSLLVEPARTTLDAIAGTMTYAVGITMILVVSIVIVVLIGSMALSYFLVRRRTREIGLRRALGATAVDVVAHLMIGNVVMLAVATVIGLAIMAALFPMLSRNQDGFTIEPWHVVSVVVAVWVLNLCAVLVPARKAASVPPTVASSAVL